MRFGTAIERLVDNYEYAKSKIWIRDEVAWALYHTWKEADGRKTENSSEKPNNCEELQDWKDRMWAEAIVTEPTISKMEQVDKDINVRSKDEPQTCDDCIWNVCNYNKAFKDEPQSLEQFRVGLEYHTDTTHFGKVKGESITTNKVENEPQTERSE